MSHAKITMLITYPLHTKIFHMVMVLFQRSLTLQYLWPYTEWCCCRFHRTR